MDTPEKSEEQCEFPLNIQTESGQITRQSAQETDNIPMVDTATGDLFEHALSN